MAAPRRTTAVIIAVAAARGVLTLTSLRPDRLGSASHDRRPATPSNPNACTGPLRACRIPCGRPDCNRSPAPGMSGKSMCCLVFLPGAGRAGRHCARSEGPEHPLVLKRIQARSAGREPRRPHEERVCLALAAAEVRGVRPRPSIPQCWCAGAPERCSGLPPGWGAGPSASASTCRENAGSPTSSRAPSSSATSIRSLAAW